MMPFMMIAWPQKLLSAHDASLAFVICDKSSMRSLIDKLWYFKQKGAHATTARMRATLFMLFL